jgi:hypothetical protein
LAADAGALHFELLQELENSRAHVGNPETSAALVKALVKANEARSLIVAAIHMDRGD